MSAKIEVEYRGLIDEKKFKELGSFLKRKGKFIGRKDKFSIIYFPTRKKIKDIREIKDEPIDLRLRIINKRGELVLKYGKWGGRDSRKEFIFPVNVAQFDEMIEFLKILGFYQGALNATTTYIYKYKGIEFSLVKVPDWGYYFEAEVATEKDKVRKANEKIKRELEKLGLHTVSNQEFYKLLNELNKRKGYRFNFRKQKFSEIKKRFIKYF
jgi:adenylate cyclase class IV